MKHLTIAIVSGVVVLLLFVCVSTHSGVDNGTGLGCGMLGVAGLLGLAATDIVRHKQAARYPDFIDNTVWFLTNWLAFYLVSWAVSSLLRSFFKKRTVSR